MSIRNLGDWSPLDRHSDPVHTDPDMVHSAQQRYQHISTTIDDAVTRLQKIVDTNSESLVGQYVAGLKEDAGSVKDKLAKAAVRYHDVAGEIAKYEPELDQGLRETAGALDDARAAKDAQTKAHAMPDPQQSEDGTVSTEEQQKAAAKEKATNQAQGDLDAAKHRLTSALGALNVAGKRLGDAVNCKRYDDGLTDTFKDKLKDAFAWISKIFGIIGMVLGVLAILIPGVNLIALAGVVAGAIALVADSVLFAYGDGSIVDVVLGAVGLGLAGLGAIASIVGKNMAGSAKALANVTGKMKPVTTHPPRLEFSPGAFGDDILLGPAKSGAGAAAGAGSGGRNVFVEFTSVADDFVKPQNPATGWSNLSDWFNNPATNWLLGKGGVAAPDVGFWQSFLQQGKGAGSMWAKLFTEPLTFGKDLAGIVGGLSGYTELAAIMASIGGKISPLWYVWGGLNGAVGLGSLIYSGGRAQEWIPSVNPPGLAEQ
jgi:hypothetical protein